MNTDQLKTFLLTADKSSFSKAEQDSHLSKQAMMKQIDSLEKEIGVPLFLRSHTGLKLTDAGRIFYDGAKEILQKEEKLMAACRNTIGENSIRIGALQHQILLDPVNEIFARKYPDIQLIRVVHPNHSGEWKVANHIQDIAESFITDSPAFDDCTFVRLTTLPYYAAMDQNHPLAGHTRINLQQMAVYQVSIFGLMVMKDYIAEMKKAFCHHPENLIIRSDVDNQVEAAFSLHGTHHIVIGANPFIRKIDGIKTIPLDTGWQRTYGILYKSPASAALQKYIETAIDVYAVQNKKSA